MTPRQLQTVNAQDLLGRPVLAQNGRAAGRIEEMRLDPEHHATDVLEFVLSTGGLLEQLSITRALFGRRSSGLIARWDQIDISDPIHPKLTCAVSELVQSPQRPHR